MANPLQQAKEMAAYNNSLALSNAKQAQSFNALEAQKNRDWQERMSNSAHQREIADLKKAGLNPVLSITGGNGASVTSGSQASGTAAPVDTSVTDGIINMAIAQMNNATTMQRVAMETQNAMAIASMNNANSWREHITPGGNTVAGQILYGLQKADEFLASNSSKQVFRSYEMSEALADLLGDDSKRWKSSEPKSLALQGVRKILNGNNAISRFLDRYEKSSLKDDYYKYAKKLYKMAVKKNKKK